MKEKKQSIARRLAAAGLCLALAASIFSPLVFAQGGILMQAAPAASRMEPAEAAPEEPAAQPEEPATQPEEAAPEEPAAQPEEPAAQPEEPAAQPEEPAAQPEEPDTLPAEESVPAPNAAAAPETAPAAEPLAGGAGLCVKYIDKDGTPQYVYDEGTLPENISSFSVYFDNNGEKQIVDVSQVAVVCLETPLRGGKAISPDLVLPVVGTSSEDSTATVELRYQDNVDAQSIWSMRPDDSDYRVRITFQPDGQERQTITLTKAIHESTGVLEGTVATAENPAQVTRAGETKFQYDVPAWDPHEISAAEGQCLFELTYGSTVLEGELADYFTLHPDEMWKQFSGQKGSLSSRGNLDQIPLNQPVTGTVTFTDIFTGNPCTIHLSYTRTDDRKPAAWYVVEGNKLVEASGKTIYADMSGKVQLRLYTPGLREVPADTETFEIYRSEVPYGSGWLWMQQTLLPDGRTVELSHKADQWSVGTAGRFTLNSDRFDFGEGNADGAFTLTVAENPYFSLQTYSTVDSTPAFAGCYQVIPRVSGGGYAVSEQQLKESGITVAYDEAELFSIAAPVKYEGQSVWAYVMFPLRDSFPGGADAITFDILKGDQPLTQIAVEAQTTWAGHNDKVQKGRIIDRAVEQQVDFEEVRSFELVGKDRDNPWTDPTAPVVAGEPVVTGAAKDNLKVLWAEGKSTFGIVYLAEQVEGQAVVTIPTRLQNGGGESSVKMVINFGKYAGDGRYESLMPNQSVDFKMVESLEVALENGNLNFEQVSVARDRMVENGPFELFFYGRRGDGACTFGSDLIKEITFASSDENVLKITADLDKADVSDTINNSDKAYGIRLTPVGTGTCDVTATIKLNRGDYCDLDKTPETVTIGYTFRVHSNESLPVETVKNAQELQALLDRMETTAVPTIIELEGGEYAMDLELEGLNVILRSKDPSDPAIFTGDPAYEPSEPLEGPSIPWQAYIVRVNPANAGLSLENIVIDGGNRRGGVLHTFTAVTVGQLPTPFTLRNCTIKNCITGVMGANSNANSIVLRGCAVEKCQTGVMSATSFNTLFSANTAAYHNPGVPRFCDFIGNQYDVLGIDDEQGGAYIETSMPQNYWGADASGKVKTGPVVGVVANDGKWNNIIEGRTAEIFSSPYYLDQTHSKLNVDLTTTQVQNGTAVLPLQQPESGKSDSLVLTAAAFAALKESGLAVSAPIRNSEGKDFASWAFPAITDGTIETNLNLSDQLSDTAQSTVDKLPESEQAKIVQEVNLSHNGTLPGRATIRIKASEVPDGDVSKLFLYWVREDGTIVPAEVVEVKYDPATGEYIITVDHCSEYVITSGELVNVVTPTPTPGGGSSGGSTGGDPAATPVPTAAPTASPAPTRKPEGPASENTQEKLFSAQQVIDSFEAQQGNVTLRLNGQTVVSQTAFALLMEREEGVLRLEGDGYAWSFDRADLTATELPGGVFDTFVDRQVDEAVLERIRDYTGESAMTALDTAFSGKLPGKAILEITVDASLFGNTRCGLFYLPEKGEPERVATVEVGADGLARLPLEHCSIYYLVVEETLPAAPDSEPAEPAPVDPAPVEPEETAPVKSGSSALPLALGGLALAAVAAAVFFIARRRGE